MRNPVKRKKSELSFTLLEVIVAVGLLTSVVLNVVSGQGALFEVTDYSQKATEATWLAKRIMAQVEYNYTNLDLKELELTSDLKEEAIKELEGTDSSDFKYSVSIREWKFPLLDILLGGGPNQTKEEKEASNEVGDNKKEGGIPGADAMIKQIFDGHILKIAHVKVSWPEGAKRNDVSLTYLLTNQKAIDNYLLTKKGTYDAVKKKMDPTQKPNPNQPPGGQPGQTQPGQVPPGGNILPDGTVSPVPLPGQTGGPQVGPQNPSPPILNPTGGGGGGGGGIPPPQGP